MAKVGVVLAGCGAQDGAEIHESVITLLALDRAGAEVQIMAPDMDQFHVINHFNGDTMEPARNILVESSRIARGNIVPAATVSGDQFDALIFPGGTGMAKNIFDYAMTGPECTVISDIERLVREIIEAGKPPWVLSVSHRLWWPRCSRIWAEMGKLRAVVINKLLRIYNPWGLKRSRQVQERLWWMKRIRSYPRRRTWKPNPSRKRRKALKNWLPRFYS